MAVRVTPPHGTRQRYMHRTLKCRCTECKQANNEYMSRYRKVRNRRGR